MDCSEEESSVKPCEAQPPFGRGEGDRDKDMGGVREGVAGMLKSG